MFRNCFCEGLTVEIYKILRKQNKYPRSTCFLNFEAINFGKFFGSLGPKTFNFDHHNDVRSNYCKPHSFRRFKKKIVSLLELMSQLLLVK